MTILDEIIIEKQNYVNELQGKVFPQSHMKDIPSFRENNQRLAKNEYHCRN